MKTSRSIFPFVISVGLAVLIHTLRLPGHPEGQVVAKWWIFDAATLALGAWLLCQPRLNVPRLTNARIPWAGLILMIGASAIHGGAGLTLRRMAPLVWVWAGLNLGLSLRALTMYAASFAGLLSLPLISDAVIEVFNGSRGFIGDVPENFISGTFGNVNLAAEAVALTTPWLVEHGRRHKTAVSRYGGIALIASNLVFLLMSRCRSAQIAAVLSFSYLAWRQWAGSWRPRVMIVATGVAIGTAFLVTGGATKTHTAGQRVTLWRQTLAMIAAHPLGVGHDEFPFRFPEFQDVGSRVNERKLARNPHDEPLRLIAEDGVVFLLGLVLVAGAMLFYFGRPPTVCAATLIAFMVQALVQFPLQSPVAFGVLLFTLAAWLSSVKVRSVDLSGARGRTFRVVTFAALLALGFRQVYPQVAVAFYGDRPEPLRLACRLNPRDTRACYVLGLALVQTSQPEACVTEMDDQLRERPHFYPYLRLRAHCRFALSPTGGCADLRAFTARVASPSADALLEARCPAAELNH